MVQVAPDAGFQAKVAQVLAKAGGGDWSLVYHADERRFEIVPAAPAEGGTAALFVFDNGGWVPVADGATYMMVDQLNAGPGGDTAGFELRMANDHLSEALALTGDPKVVLTDGAAVTALTVLSGAAIVDLTSPVVAGQQTDGVFEMTFDGSGGGTFVVDISIATSDPDRNPYTITLQGTVAVAGG